MAFDNFSFDVSDEVLAIGLLGSYFVMDGLTNKDSDPEFEQLKEQIVKEILANLSAQSIKDDAVLQGFWQLHEKVGRPGKKNVASPENLLLLLLQTGRLPHVNLLVDIYNLVSIKTRLALGAHDVAAIKGNVHLRLTNGSENFWPLGQPKSQAVGAGEYCYIDDNNDVICRLETRQVEKTKVTLDTKTCFYIVQGNAATNQTYINSATQELIALTKRFCGGIEKILY